MTYLWAPAAFPLLLLLLHDAALWALRRPSELTAAVASDPHAVFSAARLRPTLDAGRCLREPSASRGMCAPPGRRFLVVVPSECDDNQTLWLKPQVMDPGRKFDLVVMDWSPAGDCAWRLRGAADQIVHLPMHFKYHGLYRILAERHPQLLSSYDRFAFIDDDITYHTGAQGVLDVFLAATAWDLWMAQGSLSNASWVAHPVLSHNESVPGSNARLTAWVEVMTPVMSREALLQFLPRFKGQTHAWGLDSVWSHAAVAANKSLGVVDSVQIDHRAKVYLGVTKVYQRVGGIQQAWKDMIAVATRELHFTEEQLMAWRNRVRLDAGRHVFIDTADLRREPWLRPGGLSAGRHPHALPPEEEGGGGGGGGAG